eukprot:CAMPEP_0178848704 /NCGR_PEP_ID=MMETSP0746-20121128/19486_1 /TAXON_ID=913974 /ORGANISM="Nitzschia punctata, Strain CCMP561" /LENGTH=47 /DNA_ID= /DNA_START= /DNA_END= /DNA_ORIENTATION=
MTKTALQQDKKEIEASMLENTMIIDKSRGERKVKLNERFAEMKKKMQ